MRQRLAGHQSHGRVRADECVQSEVWEFAMFAGVCRLLVALAMVGISAAAVAQVIPPSELPGRERERFTTYPTLPTNSIGAPTIGLPSAEPPPSASAVQIVIRDVRISGVTVYRPDELAQLYAEFVGHKVSLTAVYEIARRITNKYGADGYVLSRALILSQTIDPAGAVIQLRVVEGYVDRVEWPKDLVLRYRDLFSEYAEKIMAERPVNLYTIERYLLLAGDLPGLRLKNRLVPSKTHPGVAATLIVEATEKPIDAMVRADNLGNTPRGPEQFLGSVSFKNPFHIHDAWTFTYAATYQTKELQYVSGNYRQVLNSEGLSFYTFGAYGWGRPGVFELEALNYRTKSLSFETGLTQPFVRTRERNVTLTALYFQSDDQSELLFTPISPLPTSDRLRGFRLRLEADWVDPFERREPVLRRVQPGHPWAGQHQQRRSVRLTILRPRGLPQVRGDLRARAGDRRRVLVLRRGARAICRNAAAVSGGMRLWRAGIRARLRSLAVDRRPLRRGARRIALRSAPAGPDVVAGAILSLCGSGLAP